jgi:hypothetical protein
MYLIKSGFIDDDWLNDQREMHRKNKIINAFLMG